MMDEKKREKKTCALAALVVTECMIHDVKWDGGDAAQ